MYAVLADLGTLAIESARPIDCDLMEHGDCFIRDGAILLYVTADTSMVCLHKMLQDCKRRARDGVTYQLAPKARC